MARTAKALSPTDSKTIRNGVRRACDWLGIPNHTLANRAEAFPKCDSDRTNNMLKRAAERPTITLSRACELMNRLESRAFEWYGASSAKQREWERALERFIPSGVREKIPSPTDGRLPAQISPLRGRGDYNMPAEMAIVLTEAIEPYLRRGSARKAFTALHNIFEANENRIEYIAHDLLKRYPLFEEPSTARQQKNDRRKKKRRK